MTNQPEAAVPPSLRLDMLEPEVGSIFTMSFVDAAFDLELREARPLGRLIEGVHERPPFTLLFVCSDRRVVAQGLYAMDHERLGRVEIFIVPVAEEADGIHYEAVFN
jgi:hypothetical protein